MVYFISTYLLQNSAYECFSLTEAITINVGGQSLNKGVAGVKHLNP